MTDKQRDGSETVLTVEDCMRGAWQALLRGDLEERSRLVALAERALKGGDAVQGDAPVEIATPEARKRMT